MLLLSYNCNNFNNFVTLAGTRLRLSEDEADALKHVAVLTIHTILLTYMCCAFVGLDGELYKMHDTNIKIRINVSFIKTVTES
jgi:hypothetical protein